MATGRTISANQLTDLDAKILQASASISVLVAQSINGSDRSADFEETYGKVSKTTRDAGSGRGGGKLQRDALVTRGVTNKAPFSNRNLRWHPLVSASASMPGQPSIDNIRISKNNVLEFLVPATTTAGAKWVPSEETYTIREKHVVPGELWEPLKDELKEWSDADWTRNSCIIKIEESCSAQNALESYGALAVAIASSLYKVSDALLDEVRAIVVATVGSVTENFPTEVESLKYCPLCLRGLDADLKEFRFSERSYTWAPNWSRSKRSEGEDGSLQVMHVNPLIEREPRHHAGNVRYGHRWCNITMTDHTIEETLKLFTEVLRGHNER